VREEAAAVSMVKFDVDTTNKLFIAKAGVTSFDVKVDLYSDAKEHWLSGGTVFGFDFPIRTIGGDPTSGGQFAGDIYFLRGGWKIRPQETNHALAITGNLYLDEGEVGSLIVPTLGGYTVLVSIDRSNLTLVVNTGTAPTQQQIRDALTLATGATPAAGSIDAQLDALPTAAEVVAAMKAEAYDGRSFEDIVIDVLAYMKTPPVLTVTR